MLNIDVKDSHRVRINLDGSWSVLHDPNNKGKKDQLYKTVISEMRECSKFPVPALWQSIDPDMRHIVWYEKSINVEPEWLGSNSAIFLRIGSANYYTELWVNGVYVGNHEGGYTAFSFELSQFVNPGWNKITIRVLDVEEGEEREGFAFDHIAWGKERLYSDVGGIWQSVLLEVVPALSVEEVKLLPDVPRNRVKAKVTLRNNLNTECQSELRILIYDKDQELLVTRKIPVTVVKETSSIETSLDFNFIPILWSCENPYLYTAIVELCSDKCVDRVGTTFGMREFTLNDNLFFTLNGNKMLLKIALRQPHYPISILAPTNREMMEKELNLVKEAGFNCIRLHLLPPVEGVLDMCDRIGLLVYEETPLGWIKDSPKFLMRAKTEIREMLARDINHPSVVIWGVLNENPSLGEKYGLELLEYLSQIDPSRLALDNSGGTGAIDQRFGWASSANVFIPGRGVALFCDLHVYVGQIEKTIDRWFAELGDVQRVPTILEQQSGNKEMLGKLSNFFANWDNAIFMSEYGYGGLSDLQSVLECFPEEATNTTDYVDLKQYLDSFTDGFSKKGLEKDFKDLSTLCYAAQEIQGNTCRLQTLAMRKNPRISGYGLTSLSDGGWGFGEGITDHFRRKTKAFDYIKSSNQPTVLILDVEPKNSYVGNDLGLQIYISSDHNWGVSHIEGFLELEINCSAYESGPINIRKNVSHRLEGNVSNLYAFMLDQEIGELREKCGEFSISGKLVCKPNNTILATGSTNFFRFKSAPQASGPNVILMSPGKHYALPSTCSGIVSTGFSSEPSLYVIPKVGLLGRDQIQSLCDAVNEGACCIFGDLDPEDCVHWNSVPGVPFEIDVQSSIGPWMPILHHVPGHQVFSGMPNRCLAGEIYASIYPLYSINSPVEHCIAWAFRPSVHTKRFSRRNPRSVLWWPDIQWCSAGKGKIIMCQYRWKENVNHDPLADRLITNLVETFSMGG